MTEEEIRKDINKRLKNDQNELISIQIAGFIENTINQIIWINTTKKFKMKILKEIIKEIEKKINQL